METIIPYPITKNNLRPLTVCTTSVAGNLRYIFPLQNYFLSICPTLFKHITIRGFRTKAPAPQTLSCRGIHRKPTFVQIERKRVFCYYTLAKLLYTSFLLIINIIPPSAAMPSMTIGIIGMLSPVFGPFITLDV